MRSPFRMSAVLAILLPAIALTRSYMTDEAPAAAATDSTEPTKESLLARVESLLEAGYNDVKTVLHDVISDVEAAFGHSSDAANVTPAGTADAADDSTGEDAGKAAPATTDGSASAAGETTS
jgi:hypothetical protein